MMVDWDQVREMYKGGIEFGGHTMSHPILTRISIDQASQEIEGSKARIEGELGEPILGFAYPNGLANDFDIEIERLTARAGYRAAFTLLNGPSSQREVMRNPFAIRRVFISHKHSLPDFAVLVSGFNRYRPQ
jgi:peptidoglycan/xylan/chitin deacetylase (PgdA/CDA1 family)